VVERILGVALSVQAIEASVAEAASEVPAFYAQPAAPPAPVPDATLLVVQAEGHGGPLVQPSPAAPPGRLAKGPQRGKQQEAVVTGLSTVAPYQRTAQEVVVALLREPGSPQVSPRPAPVAKALHATLEGQAVAMRQLVERVTRREGPHIQHRIARTAGAEARQPPVVTHLPAYTLSRDIMHAPES
jgi:hypothetical protein